MMALEVVLVSLCLILSGINAETSEERFYANYMAALKAYNESGGSWDQDIGLQSTSSRRPIDVEYECGDDLSALAIPPPPQNIHELSPYYVKVIGAVGDSVTAGFGESGKLFEALTEFRGASWSIGGDGDIVSLPNFIRHFQEKTGDILYGYSTGKGKSTASNSVLNRAVSGAVASDIPGQVADLMNKMKERANLGYFDWDDDWKMVTLWIGGNDLCAYCNEPEAKSPSNYVKHIEAGLKQLADNVPKLFVNVVEILDVTELASLEIGLLCGVIHGFACPCKTKSIASKAQKEYNDQLEKMVDDFNNKYRNDPDNDDFEAVLQPFYKNVKLPDKDAGSYFGLDCFHFNFKGHAEAALALWNSMLTPIGKKDDKVDWTTKKARCPMEDHVYFATERNSKSFVSSFGAQDQPDADDGNSLALILGTSLSAFVVILALVVVVVIAGVLYIRRRRQHNQLRGTSVGVSMDTEKTRLIFRQ